MSSHWMFLTFMMVAVTALAAVPPPEDYEKACRRYAKEEDVKSEDLPSYLAQCLEDLRLLEREQPIPVKKK
ncbi:exported hypothetical protein [Gammaproteobacteria bacterium]